MKTGLIAKRGDHDLLLGCELKRLDMHDLTRRRLFMQYELFESRYIQMEKRIVVICTRKR